MIRVPCAKCGEVAEVSDATSGSRVACLRCGNWGVAPGRVRLGPSRWTTGFRVLWYGGLIALVGAVNFTDRDAFSSAFAWITGHFDNPALLIFFVLISILAASVVAYLRSLKA